MRIMNNIPALTAFTSLNSTNDSLQKIIGALSTGLRINSASDDAAGFAVSEKMRSQIHGLDTALRNSQDGISLLQTAEGALGETNSMLQRMRDLSVQASNDSLTSNDRQYIQLEIDEIMKQIDQIANTTQFNKKRILDGSSGALWASSDLGVSVRINGGLTRTDNFGQKVSSEGNYRIEVTASPGEAQVQKTNIMCAVSNQSTAKAGTTAKIVFCIDVSGSMGRMLQTVKDNIAAFKSKIEGSGVENVEIGICTYGTADISDPNFVAYTYPSGDLWSSDIDEIRTLLAPITAPYPFDTYNYYGVQKAAEAYGGTFGSNRYMVLVTDVDHTTYPDDGLSPEGARADYTEETVRAALFGDASTSDDDISLSVIGPLPDSTSSEFYNLCKETEGKMFSSTADWASGLVNDLGLSIAEESGDLEAASDKFPPSPRAKLSRVNNFITAEGVFILERPKQITLSQGGKNATVTLDASDTLGSLAEKLNSAIGVGLGHMSYTSDGRHFATYVSEEEAADATSQGAPGTIVIRSGITGKEGEITFSGDEDLLNALGLNTIRESSETNFTASIYDAHSGKVILSGEKLTGNVIHDALTGVDIEFGSMAGIKSSWEEGSKRFVFTSGDKYSAVIHLKDNGITFHTGANMGEDFSIQLGDMSAKSLGLSRVNLSTRESAASSIGIIDRAITRISSQRAKIGAYINGLEHTMSSLTTTSANLTQAESRLRDADMAKTMMDFVRLQILNQSGTSMLAQANQIPQSVMSLMQ